MINLKSAMLITPILYIFVAITDECLQLFSPGRACAVNDMILDTCGATTGLLFSLAIFCLFQKVKKNGGSKNEFKAQ